MARLPIPGADEGTWGNLLNEFLEVEHNGDGTLKSAGSLNAKADKTTSVSAGTGLTGGGDLSTSRTISANFGTSAGTVAQGNDTRIVGAEQTANKGIASGYASLDGSGKVPVTQLPTGTDASQVAVGDHSHTYFAGLYPLTEYGFFTASAPIEAFTGNSTLNEFFAARIFVPAGHPIVGAGTIVRNAGTLGAGGQNGFGVYEADGTLAAATPADDSLWASAGWRTKAFSSAIPAQSSDRFVYGCIIVAGYSAPPNILYNVIGSIAGIGGGGYGVSNHRRSFYSNATTWPASFDPLTYGNDPFGFLPLIALA